MMKPEFFLENVEMKSHTSFRVGGKARYFAKPESAEEVALSKDFAKENGLPLFVLGRGSNVVVSDAGFDGVIIQLGKPFSQFKFDGETLSAGAGASLSALARACATLGLSGLHLLAGIPGSVGGAVSMNAGAYGQEISKTLEAVQFLGEDNAIREFSAEECLFGYRSSAFRESAKILLSATFSLKRGQAAELLAEQKKVLEERRQKQPLEYPSAGSMFKRPENAFPGALIEQAGLKGLRIGGAEVSTKHANFIVNADNASAEDVYRLSELVREKVFQKSGIRLEREVIFLGKFGGR